MKKRNERKIDKTVRAFNEVKETLTVDELISFQSSLARYIKCRQNAKRKEVTDDKSSFKDVIDSFEQLIKFSKKILARGKPNGSGKNL